MCDPGTVGALMIASTVATAGGQVQSGLYASRVARNQAMVAQQNKQLAREGAADTIVRGQEQQRQLGRVRCGGDGVGRRNAICQVPVSVPEAMEASGRSRLGHQGLGRDLLMRGSITPPAGTATSPHPLVSSYAVATSDDIRRNIKLRRSLHGGSRLERDSFEGSVQSL